VAVARQHYERALEIAFAEDADRPDLLLSLGEMLTLGGEYSAAVQVLEEAVDLFRSMGDSRGLIRTLLRLQFALSVSGSRRPELGEEALALARSGPPSQELVDALTEWGATQYFVSGNPQVAVDAIDEAERVCEQQGFALSPWPLASRGGFRCALGDAAGLADFRRAVEMARNSNRNGYGFELSSCMSSLAVVVDWVEGPAASLRELDDCIRFCERRGMLADAAFMRITGLELRLTSGDWVTLSADIATDERTFAPADQPQNVRTLAAVRLMLPAWQGRLDGLPEALASTEAIRPDIATPWEDAYDAVPSSVAAAALGLSEAAERRLSDWAATPETASTVEYAWMVPSAVRTALSCSGLGLADRLRHRGDGRLPVQQHIMATVGSLLNEASGKHEAASAGFALAAGRWHEFGVPYEEGQALLGQGRCLVMLDQAPDASIPLAAAREIFARLGAKPAMAETNEWLARTNRA
jgi:tetratricopeptide (TPR) repeat protein